MFQEVLQRCVDVNDEEYVKWSELARKYGIGVTKDDGVVEQSRELFLSRRVVSLRVWSRRVASLRVWSRRVVSLRGWSREF